MPRTTSDNGLRAAVSVTQMAKMVGLSRAAFYAHVRQGHFVAPTYSTSNRRPVYTAELQRQNLEVRATQLGVNGDYVLFYERRTSETVGNSTRRPSSARSLPGDIRRRLEGLGLTGLTDTQVESAFAACFPQGAPTLPADEVLRVVYRHLRRTGGA